MKSNRRSVLIGLGALTVGGGAVFGTGAFSQVEADRTVNVNVEDDANAFLGLTSASGAGDYVDETGDAIVIDIGVDGTDGVNTDAVTTFNELVQITNNGTNNVTSISFSLTGTNNPEDAITVTPDGGFDNNFGGTDSSFLATTESETFGLEIDLTDSGGLEQDLDGVTLSITASTS